MLVRMLPDGFMDYAERAERHFLLQKREAAVAYGYVYVDRKVVGGVGDCSALDALADLCLGDVYIRTSFPEEDVVNADQVVRLVRIVQCGLVRP